MSRIPKDGLHTDEAIDGADLIKSMTHRNLFTRGWEASEGDVRITFVPTGGLKSIAQLPVCWRKPHSRQRI